MAESTPNQPVQSEAPAAEPSDVAVLRAAAPDLTWEEKQGYLNVRIGVGDLVRVSRRCRELGYDYLSAITAVDYSDRVELLYHLYSYDYTAHPGCVVIRLDLPPETNPLCPSVTGIWAGAEYQEREIYDLFGVRFPGNPDLRRILNGDDFRGHPLRKDWQTDFDYILVKHLKFGAEQQDLPPGAGEGFRRV
ncbi:MAG: NADH-quinone oxidoreductase subunit C [Chloroflexota bacterium]